MTIQKNPPPPLIFVEIFLYFLAVLRAYITQGKKIRIISLFFTPISFFHLPSSFPPFFPCPPLHPQNSSLE